MIREGAKTEHKSYTFGVMTLSFDLGAFFHTILFGAGKIVAGLIVLLGPLSPQPLTLASTTSHNPWALPSRLNVGEIVSTLNPARPLIPSPAAPSAPGSAPAPATPRPVPAPAPIPVITPSPVPPPVITPAPEVDLAALNASVRSAVVNVLCTAAPGSPMRSISGSGVIIDPRGVVLTNAHVAQGLLLKDYPSSGSVSCVVRIGSPARAMYTTKLLYISKEWVRDNAYQLLSSEPIGTGENDYALLLIDGRTDPSASLPASFDYLVPDASKISLGESLLLCAYPASLLGTISASTNLYASTAYANVQQVFAFYPGRSDTDLFSVGGTVVAQGGSSGGAAVRAGSGTLAGIFVTAVEGATTAESDLRALALTFIDAALYAEGENGLIGALSGNLSAKASAFNSGSAPALAQYLLNVLGR